MITLLIPNHFYILIKPNYMLNTSKTNTYVHFYGLNKFTSSKIKTDGPMSEVAFPWRGKALLRISSLIALLFIP